MVLQQALLILIMTGLLCSAPVEGDEMVHSVTFQSSSAAILSVSALKSHNYTAVGSSPPLNGALQNINVTIAFLEDNSTVNDVYNTAYEYFHFRISCKHVFDSSVLNSCIQKKYNLSKMLLLNVNKRNEPLEEDVCINLFNTKQNVDSIDDSLYLESACFKSIKQLGTIKKVTRSIECLDKNCSNQSSITTFVNQTDIEMRLIVDSLMTSIKENDAQSFRQMLNESLEKIIQHHENVNIYIILPEDFYTTILNLAITMKNYDIVSALLDADADPTISDVEGRAALHACVLKGNLEILELLLSNNKTDIDQRGSSGETALHLSVIMRRTDMVESLLDKDADPYLPASSGETALFFAATTDLHFVELILAVSDAGINRTDDYGRTPLYMSVSSGHFLITEFLLENHADPNIPDILGRTPLIISITQNTDDISELLLAHGADPYFSNNPLGVTPFHLAVMNRNQILAESILNNSKNGINDINNQGASPLHIAVSNNDAAMVNMLLENGADPYTEVLHRKWTALHVVADSDLPEIGEILLAHNRSGIDLQNDIGQTALYRSVLRNSTGVFDLLMKYDANTTIATAGGYTPLMVSVAVGSHQMAERLLEKTNDSIDDQNKLGETALVIAANYNNTDIFEQILSKGAKAHIVTYDGLSPLHVAIKWKNILIADLLLKYNKTIIDIQDKNGRTAMFVAVDESDKDMLEYLLRHGSNPAIRENGGLSVLHKLVMQKNLVLIDSLLELNRSGIDQRSLEGNTAVHMSIIIGDVPTFQALMKHGANAYIPNDEGVTPLHLAAFQNFTEIVQHLLAINASSVNLKSKNGQTALHYGFACPSICDALLKHGADVMATDGDGKTALHYAVTNGIVDTVILILDKRSPAVNISDENGQTPLHYALNENRTDIITLLLNASAEPNPVSILGIMPLHLAAKNGHREFVEYVLNLSKTYINRQTHDGYTALHFALDSNITDIIEILFKEGADPRIPDYNGHTAYHFAVFSGNLQALQLFLQKNVSAVNIQDIEGKSLLAIAASYLNEEIFDFLLSKGADYTLIDNNGKTIIHEAARKGGETILKKVIHKAINLINTTDYAGFTPLFMVSGLKNTFDFLFDKGADPFIPYRGSSVLHMAAFLGNINAIEKILNKFGNKINIEDPIGMIPLTNAIYGGKKDAVRYLIKNGANVLHSNFFNENFLHTTNKRIDASIIVDIIFNEINKTLKGDMLSSFLNQRNAHGLTAISKAAVTGNELVFRTLWEAGSNPYIASIREDNILHQAARGGNRYIIDFVLNRIKINIDAKNYNGITPLMKAAESGEEFGFSALLRLGANAEETSSLNETLLHFAAIGGNAKIINEVLSLRNTKIDATDGEGYTPLMYACIYGNVDSAKALLLGSADPLVENIYGQSSLELAARQGDVRILSLFELLGNTDDWLLGSILANPPSDYGDKDDEDLIKELLKHSSIATNPILYAAATGDDVNLLKAFNKYHIPRKMKLPYIMKQFMKEYDSLIEELLVNERVHPSAFERYTTPLDVALLFFGKASTVKLIIENLKINIKSLYHTRAMWTPLDLVVFSMARYKRRFLEKKQILYFLLKNDKTPLGKPNMYGWTIVHKAAWFGNILVMQLLKKEGVDLQKPDKYGRTPLHIAALKGYPRIVELLLKDSNKNVNKRDLYGFTPLHLVQVYGRRKFFSRLSFAKSDMDAKDRYAFLENIDLDDVWLGGRTRSYQDTMFLLLYNGADIDSQDYTFGWTPLHWAAINGDVWKTVTLVNNGAVLNLPSRTGVTPLWLARFWGRKVIYHYLKSKGGVW